VYEGVYHLNKTKIVVFSILFLLIIVAILLYMQIQPSKNPSSLEVEISTGDTLQDVGKKLEEKAIIKNNTLFELYGKYKGYDRQIKSGVHQFEKPLTYKNIYTTLIQSKREKGITVTIPEGFTVEQIADELKSKGITDIKKFLALAKTGEGLEHPLLKLIPKSDSVNYRLEGYLFPETYYFKKGSKPEKVIYKMLDQFSVMLKKFENVESEKINEWVTIASLVEEEARVDKERPIIAGVIFNRIDKGMKLQIDATVQYALGEVKERLFYKDLEIESPYNTYLNNGLPPGPIASPGLSSFEAVTDPKEHDFFYYVVKNDGTGAHYFAETYEEHLANINKSK
jgi:UPF0755 protein